MVNVCFVIRRERGENRIKFSSQFTNEKDRKENRDMFEIILMNIVDEKFWLRIILSYLLILIISKRSFKKTISF